jgi:hypothetical protein
MQFGYQCVLIKKYSNFRFVKGTLKDHVRDVLKELKLGNSN